MRGSVIIAKVAPAKEPITPVLVAKPNIITKTFAERIAAGIAQSLFIGLIIVEHTGDHNTITPSKEIAIFYDLELLYNVRRLRAPGNRTPLTTLQFSFINNANLNYAP